MKMLQVCSMLPITKRSFQSAPNTLPDSLYDSSVLFCSKVCFAASALLDVVFAKSVRGLTLQHILVYYFMQIYICPYLFTWRFLKAASFAVAGDMILSEGET